MLQTQYGHLALMPNQSTSEKVSTTHHYKPLASLLVMRWWDTTLLFTCRFVRNYSISARQLTLKLVNLQYYSYLELCTWCTLIYIQLITTSIWKCPSEKFLTLVSFDWLCVLVVSSYLNTHTISSAFPLLIDFTTRVTIRMRNPQNPLR